MSDDARPDTKPGQCPTCGETRLDVPKEYLGTEEYDDARRKLYAAFRAYMLTGEGGDGPGFIQWARDDADDMTAWWENRKRAGLE